MSKVTRTAAVVAAVAIGAIVFASVAAASDHHAKRHEHHRRGAELRFAHAFEHHPFEHHVFGVSSSAGSTLELRKIVVPASDGGRFNLIARYLKGALISRTANVGNGASSGRFAIPSGRLLNVEETAGTNTTLSDYTSQIACAIVSGPDMGTVFPTVWGHAVRLIAKAGDGYTCTFTNTRVQSGGTTTTTTTSTTTTTPTPAAASLELRKMVVPASDSGRFNLIARYLRGALISRTANVGNGASSGRFAIPTGRLLNIEETAGTNTTLSNYTSQISCSVVSGPDMGTVFATVPGHAVRLIAKPGDGYTCTFTNTRKSS